MRPPSICLHNGTDEVVAKNAEQTFAYLKRAAELGHREAQYEAALCYRDGQGTARDMQEAHALFQKAAQQEHPDAQYEFAKADPDRALEWLTKAAHQDHREAQFELAQRVGIEDKKAATEWMEKAASLGHREAQFEMGKYYKLGIGVKADQERALVWYERAAAQDHPEALLIVAKNYMPQKIWILHARHYLLKAAKAGIQEAQYLVAMYHLIDTDFPKYFSPYPEKALYWLRKAGEEDNPEAAYAMACSYKDVPSEKIECREWLEAARAGHTEAQVRFRVTNSQSFF